MFKDDFILTNISEVKKIWVENFENKYKIPTRNINNYLKNPKYKNIIDDLIKFCNNHKNKILDYGSKKNLSFNIFNNSCSEDLILNFYQLYLLKYFFLAETIDKFSQNKWRLDLKEKYNLDIELISEEENIITNLYKDYEIINKLSLELMKKYNIKDSDIFRELLEIAILITNFKGAKFETKIRNYCRLDNYINFREMAIDEFSTMDNTFKIDFVFNLFGKKYGVQCKSYTYLKFNENNYYQYKHLKEYRNLVNKNVFDEVLYCFYNIDNNKTMLLNNNIFINFKYLEKAIDIKEHRSLKTLELKEIEDMEIPLYLEIFSDANIPF